MIIYKIKFPNNKFYIGATSKTLDIRRKWHYSAANSKSDYPVHCALRKYINEVEWEVLFECDNLTFLYEKEIYFIDLYQSSVKKNGYNVKLGGFHVTGTHSQSLSEKRKKFFLDKKNRIQSSIDHGGYSFVVYDFIKQEVVGTWINQTMASEFLGVSAKGLHNALKGDSKTVKNFIVAKQRDMIPTLLKSVPTAFKVINKDTKIETIWYSKSDCQRELGIARATISKAFTGHIFAESFKYQIVEIKHKTIIE